jgi:hypothetical protein
MNTQLFSTWFAAALAKVLVIWLGTLMISYPKKEARPLCCAGLLLDQIFRWALAMPDPD